jgi:cyanophycin synthetase
MTTKSKIAFEQIVNLRGPNSWTYRPVLEAWVDFAAIENHPPTHKAAALARLLAWVPELAQSHLNPEASPGTQGTLAAGRWSPQILEHLTLTLQSLADMPGGFGDTHQTSELAVYKVVVRAWHPSVTTFALHAARDLLEAAFNDTQVDVKATIVRLQDLRHKHCLGPSTACIVDAADDRDIPAIRLNTGNLLQLGYGINQRRIWTAETDRTGAIAETISREIFAASLRRTRPYRSGCRLGR